jgi:hypothetical protein
MAYFAKIGTGNIVEKVISVNNSVITDSNGIEQEQLGVDFINNLYGTNDVWKKTSYNTRLGKYYDMINNKHVLSQDQSKAFRINFAGLGMVYNSTINGFTEKQPFPSWTLNVDTGDYSSPIPRPEDGNIYQWNETSQIWIAINS